MRCWISISTLYFFFTPFSYMLLVWKLLKLSLLWFTSQVEKAIPKSYEQIMFVCIWVSSKYYRDTTDMLETEWLTKWASFTQQFHTSKFHSNIKALMVSNISEVKRVFHEDSFESLGIIASSPKKDYCTCNIWDRFKLDILCEVLGLCAIPQLCFTKR